MLPKKYRGWGKIPDSGPAGKNKTGAIEINRGRPGDGIGCESLLF